jgi:hypothetical protein
MEDVEGLLRHANVHTPKHEAHYTNMPHWSREVQYTEIEAAHRG